MKDVLYVIFNILETLLRVLPFPNRTGLIKIGNPDRESPVLLTCNYNLTVERVKRALKGIDAYLLVANSRGINVWCGAAGGHFSHHDVISVLKTSGIEKLVDHRTVVLPQLAATGIEAKAVQERSGWRIVWGPVYAKDIPDFLQNGFEKVPSMREVNFSWQQRTEMAIAWAFPISLIAALVLLALWREAIPYVSAMVWGLSFLIFLSFPLYHRWLGVEARRFGFIFFDFGRGGFQLILWGLFIVALAAYELSTGDFTWSFVLRWAFAALVVIIILSLDLTGSTPVYHSGLHEDRLLKVILDESRCKGAGFCEQVCPRNCYELDREHHIATIPRSTRCIQCGACIVQCPFDALCFRSPKGKILLPESIRKFKLNLIGKRIGKM